MGCYDFRLPLFILFRFRFFFFLVSLFETHVFFLRIFFMGDFCFSLSSVHARSFSLFPSAEATLSSVRIYPLRFHELFILILFS